MTGQVLEVLEEVMDAKYLGITLCNDPEQTVYFSLSHSFMEYGATVWDPYQKYNSDKVEMVQRRAARFVKSSYSKYS